MKTKQDKRKVNAADILISGAIGAFTTIGAKEVIEPFPIDTDLILFIAATLGSMVCALLIVLITEWHKHKNEEILV